MLNARHTGHRVVERPNRRAGNLKFAHVEELDVRHSSRGSTLDRCQSVGPLHLEAENLTAFGVYLTTFIARDLDVVIPDLHVVLEPVRNPRATHNGIEV